MVVLMNLASSGRRGESCARLGATSRVALWKPLVWSSSVRQLEVWADGGLEVAQQWVWRCLVVLGSHNVGDGAAVLGMVAQRRGWPHRPMMTEETCSTGPTSRRRPVRERGRRLYPY
jgi:hypothetical protein